MADSNTLLIKEYSIVLTALGFISTIIAPDQGPNTGIGWVANTDGLLFARDINKDHKK